MRTTLIALLTLLVGLPYAKAQQPKKLNPSEIYEAIQKLNFLLKQ